jgi:hypothetical protein
MSSIYNNYNNGQQGLTTNIQVIMRYCYYYCSSRWCIIIIIIIIITSSSIIFY